MRSGSLFVTRYVILNQVVSILREYGVVTALKEEAWHTAVTPSKKIQALHNEWHLRIVRHHNELLVSSGEDCIEYASAWRVSSHVSKDTEWRGIERSVLVWVLSHIELAFHLTELKLVWSLLVLVILGKEHISQWWGNLWLLIAFNFDAQCVEGAIDLGPHDHIIYKLVLLCLNCKAWHGARVVAFKWSISGKVVCLVAVKISCWYVGERVWIHSEFSDYVVSRVVLVVVIRAFL